MTDDFCVFSNDYKKSSYFIIMIEENIFKNNNKEIIFSLGEILFEKFVI